MRQQIILLLIASVIGIACAHPTIAEKQQELKHGSVALKLEDSLNSLAQLQQHSGSSSVDVGGSGDGVIIRVKRRTNCYAVFGQVPMYTSNGKRCSNNRNRRRGGSGLRRFWGRK